MILPDFPFTITYCPATKSEHATLGIEAHIGTRRLRAVTEICSDEQQNVLDAGIECLLEQIADTHVFQEAYGAEEIA